MLPMSRTSKIDVAYNFFKEKFDKSCTFTIDDIVQEIKWKSSTVITYINKIWKPFINHDSIGLRVNDNFKHVDIKKFKEYHPEAALTQELRNKFNQTIMAVYTIK